jgi:hypothetical protein
MAVKKKGGRKPGDTNHSLREKRLIAQNEKLRADVAAAKAKVKVRDAVIKEMREKFQAALTTAKNKLAPATAKKATRKKP